MAEETCFAVTTPRIWWQDKKLIKCVESFKRGIVKVGEKILGTNYELGDRNSVCFDRFLTEK